jgi:hypothetical protein
MRKILTCAFLNIRGPVKETGVCVGHQAAVSHWKFNHYVASILNDTEYHKDNETRKKLQLLNSEFRSQEERCFLLLSLSFPRSLENKKKYGRS